MDRIRDACAKNDTVRLAEALKEVGQLEENLTDYYLKVLREKPFHTVTEIANIVAEVNEYFTKVHTTEQKLGQFYKSWYIDIYAFSGISPLCPFNIVFLYYNRLTIGYYKRLMWLQ